MLLKQPTNTKQEHANNGTQTILHIGNPATIALVRFRPEALRPRFSTGLPKFL